MIIFKTFFLVAIVVVAFVFVIVGVVLIADGCWNADKMSFHGRMAKQDHLVFY